MALQLWMPLMGDLRNQGLSNFDITTLGTISWVNGKLGAKALQAGNASQTTNGVSINSNLTDLLSEEYSISVWVKPLGNHVHYNGTILSSGDWNHTRWAFGVSQDNTKVDMLSNGYNIYVNCTVPVNEWTHLVCTCNSSNQIRLYKNGEYITYTTRSDRPQSDATNTTIGRETYAGGYFSFNGVIQDLRLYDHCLSPMEVKQLSQGLVLHYPLSDEYIESTTNLVTTEDGLSNTCYNGVTSKYGYGTNTDMYKTLGVFEGRKSTKVYMGTAGLSAYPYVYFDNFNASGTTIQTLSFDYYPTIQNTLIPYSYNGSYNFSYTTDKTSGSASNAGQITIPVEVGRWNHIIVTAQKADTTNTSRGIGYIRIGSTSHTSTTSNYWLFGNVQIEAKDHATGYAGVGGTRNSTIVYDCSGFINNGVVSGNLTISNDTPKYSVSTKFNGTEKISADSLPSEVQSVSFWVKVSTIPSGYGICYVDSNTQTSIGFYNGNSFITSCTVSANVVLLGTTFKANEWNHIVLIKTGTNTRNVYCNGILLTNSGTNSWVHNGNNLSLGWRDYASGNAGWFNGQLCDFRAYTTALSADDVKSLYQNSAYVDSSGNVYGAVHSEV